MQIGRISLIICNFVPKINARTVIQQVEIFEMFRPLDDMSTKNYING